MLNRCCGLGTILGFLLVGSCLEARPVFAAELEEIEQRGYLTVAVKDNLRPLGFRTADGALVGLEIDIARRLAADLLGDAEALRLEPVANQDRLPRVIEGEVDLAIAHVTVTGPRARVVNFSRPYYTDGTALVTRDATLQQLSDLRNLPIAVLEGSSAIASVRSLLPAAQLVGVSSYEEALTYLETDRAIAFAGDASVLTGWVQEYPQYRLLPTLLSAEALSIVMPHGLQYDDLRRRVNDAIDRWQAEGWLQERIEYWGLPQ